MRRTMLMLASVVCLIVLGSVLISRGISAQDATAVPAPIYNPYPPGILPSDLNSELARVLRETSLLEGRAITRWHA